jgi:hypothetical protein
LLQQHLQFILLWFWRWGGGGVSLATCPGWPGTAVLRISASPVARIAGMSFLTEVHWFLSDMAHVPLVLFLPFLLL